MFVLFIWHDQWIKVAGGGGGGGGEKKVFALNLWKENIGKWGGYTRHLLAMDSVLIFKAPRCVRRATVSDVVQSVWRESISDRSHMANAIRLARRKTPSQTKHSYTWNYSQYRIISSTPVETDKTDPWLSPIPVHVGHIFWSRIYMYIACALKSF